MVKTKKSQEIAHAMAFKCNIGDAVHVFHENVIVFKRFEL